MCKCGLIESVCNTLQKYNHDEFQCDCKELNGWGSCIDDYIWNSSTGNFECSSACKIDGYLDMFRKNYSCEKRLFDKLVLMCEDEILNATETLPGKKVAICEKYFIQIIHIALFPFSHFIGNYKSVITLRYWKKYIYYDITTPWTNEKN